MKMEIEKFFEQDQVTYSQLKQDLFALYHKQDEPGFFVEFGSLDGVDTSNTYILEKYHGWHGILAEPLPRFYDELHRNRACVIDHRCVFSHSGDVVQFGEVEDFPAVSTLISHKDQQSMWKEKRQTNKIHDVVTVSLDDLLDEHNAPAVIDYLSIDTEGSEFTILSTHSFKRPFNTISVEYANADERHKLYNLLTYHKYIRVHAKLSQWEDWYVYAPFYVEKYH
jgi:FkbM family methyltransferase